MMSLNLKKEKNPLHLSFPQAFLIAQLVKNLPAMRETWVWSLGWEDPLEKGKATHSNILAWRIPCLYSPWGCKDYGRDWTTFTHSLTTISPGFHSCIHECSEELTIWARHAWDTVVNKREIVSVLGELIVLWGRQTLKYDSKITIIIVISREAT